MTAGQLVRTATDLDFADAVLGAAGPVLVAFHEGELDADLDALAREAHWLTCVRLDALRWPLTPAAYRVTRLPALVFFHHGEPVLVLDGHQPPAVVRRMVAALQPQV